MCSRTLWAAGISRCPSKESNPAAINRALAIWRLIEILPVYYIRPYIDDRFAYFQDNYRQIDIVQFQWIIVMGRCFCIVANL